MGERFVKLLKEGNKNRGRGKGEGGKGG